MKKVFLGGTCGSEWRQQMIHYLDRCGLEYFNPVVDNWDQAAQAKEIYERKHCDFCLYTITPKMIGTYSIAEVVDDSNKAPNKTLLVVLRTDKDCEFTESQWKSLESVARLVERNGALAFLSLESAAVYLGGVQQVSIAHDAIVTEGEPYNG